MSKVEPQGAAVLIREAPPGALLRLRTMLAPHSVALSNILALVLLLVIGWALYCIEPGRITFRFQNVLAQLSVTYLIASMGLRRMARNAVAGLAGPGSIRAETGSRSRVATSFAVSEASRSRWASSGTSTPLASR